MCQIEIKMPSMKSTSKTDQENGMICHISTKYFRDIMKLKPKYDADTAIFSNFPQFLEFWITFNSRRCH